MQLNLVVERIESAFGPALPFSGRSLTAEDQTALSRIFGDDGYQRYLQDQVNRQIIRDYMTNAVLLGHLPEQQLERLDELADTREGRSTLSLHMLMSSVEDAAHLLDRSGPDRLEPLRPGSDSPPHMRLVRS